MRKYWSCSKFADWVRGTPKLNFGTSKEWDQWHTTAKSTHPFRYWLAEQALDLLGDAWVWVPDKLNSIRYYLNNRYTTRTHTLTSNLPRGEWHEFDTRILHCLFDELVNFVEIEQAWIHVAWDDEARKKYNLPFWRQQWWTRWFRVWRCPEAGIAHLEWASGLRFDDSMWVAPTDPEYGTPTPQSKAAREIYNLYYWWKYVRPLRVDPMDYSGWTKHCDEERAANDGKLSLSCECRTEEERQKVSAILAATNTLEENYDLEDEEMLVRLIKIRKNLWT